MNALELLVVRHSFTETSTEGDLLEGSTRLCHTLEDTVRAPGVKVYGDTAIPFGRYRLGIRTSPLFRRDVLWVLDVPDFELIYLHSGNKIADTLGCILVGYDPTTRTDAWIGNSRAAENALFNRVAPVIRAGGEAWLSVAGPTLRIGMGGRSAPALEMAAVRVLQRWLRMPEEYRTGYFGPLTDAAVRDVQYRHGLFVDGRTDADTWVKLAA